MPSKHGSFTQCCFYVGPVSKTVGKLRNSTVWIPRVCWIAKWTRLRGQLAYHTMPSKHDTSTQCPFNAGPPLSALSINLSTLDSAFCWRWCVQRVQADTDPMSVKCWASVASIHSALVSTSCWRYQYDAWTKAGLMLARRLWRWPTFSVAPNTTQ